MPSSTLNLLADLGPYRLLLDNHHQEEGNKAIIEEPSFLRT